MSAIESSTSAPRLGPKTIAACVILLSLMTWQAVSAYWQCDDAYISFRYVWNLVHGHGLVFNQGEHVEGYTNFLWVLELAAIQALFGIVPEVACDFLSALYSLLSVAVVIRMAWPAGVFVGRHFVLLGTLLLLATSHTWAVWGTSGLETRQFTFFVLLGLLATSRSVHEPRKLIFASLSFALAELTRPEGLMIGGCAGAWLLFELYWTKRLSWKPLLAFAVPFALVVGAHYLWRRWYYDDWFPNTYYAKHVRSWPEAGWRYFVSAAIECGVWFMLPFAIVGLCARCKQGERTFLLYAFVVGVHVVYLFNIGGDHFELRPLDFYWPLFFVPTLVGMWIVSAWFAQRTGKALTVVSAVVLLSLATVYGGALQHAKLLDGLTRDTRESSYRYQVKLTPEKCAWLFAIPPMPVLVPVYNDLQIYLVPHGVGLAWREHERFWRDEMTNWAGFERVRNTGVFPADAVTARMSTGVYGYYLADIPLIDILGLTDRYVAHQPVKRTNEQRVMAHDRKAELDYLERRGFNVLFDPLKPTRRLALEQQNYALRVADDVWAPTLSPKPKWFTQSKWGLEIWEFGLEREVGCFRADASTDWTLEGDAFRLDAMPHGPVQAWPARCDISHGLSSKGRSEDVELRGRARSPEFVVPEDTRLEVRLCGVGPNAGVRLVDASGAELARVLPFDADWLMPARIDLGPHAGKTVRVELFDDDGSWVQCAGVVVLAPRLRRSPP